MTERRSVERVQYSRRRWTFRGLAVVVGLLPFVAAEVILRSTGIGAHDEVTDPFVGFHEVRPLFVLDEQRAKYVIPPSRKPYFKPDEFAAVKSPGEFRIFCFGGSTVQGNPYSIETSFTTWLELDLQAADPDRQWQVVNCGGISYASYRLAPLLRECLKYKPDLFVLYLGDNEFLENRTYEHVKCAAWVTRGHTVLAHSRLYDVVWEHFRGGETKRDGSRGRSDAQTLATEVDALLDYQGGLEEYHRDDAWRRGVIDHFRFTLSRMLHDAKEAGIPVLLVDPVCNLKDCPPFKVEFGGNLSASEKTRLHTRLSEASASDGSPQDSIDLVREVLAADERHAGAWFLLGRKLLETGQTQEAREAFLRAKDEDVCPLRLIEPLREVIYQVGRANQTPVVPVMHRFEEASTEGIPGDGLLMDHVHPSITGHQMIARLLLQTMQELGMVDPQTGWNTQAQILHRRHLQTLDTPYFARGKEHLEGLRKWTEGRVTKVRTGTP